MLFILYRLFLLFSRILNCQDIDSQITKQQMMKIHTIVVIFVCLQLVVEVQGLKTVRNEGLSVTNSQPQVSITTPVAQTQLQKQQKKQDSDKQLKKVKISNKQTSIDKSESKSESNSESESQNDSNKKSLSSKPIKSKIQSESESQSNSDEIKTTPKSKTADSNSDSKSDSQSVSDESDNKKKLQKTQKSPQSQIYQVSLKIKDNKCYTPIQIDKKQYSLGLSLSTDEPSWIFTSLTKTHEKCDKDNNCDQNQEILACTDKKSCQQSSNSKLQATKQIIGNKTVNIYYKNQNKTIEDEFISATKVTLGEQYEDIDKLVGVKSFNGEQIEINNYTTKVGNIADKFPITMSDLQKKQVWFRYDKNAKQNKDDDQDQDQDQKNKPETAKVSFSTIKFSFDAQFTLKIPKQLYTELYQLLKKQYLNNSCKLYSGKLKCSKKVQLPHDRKVDLCFSQKKNNCVQLNVESLMKINSDNDKKIDLLFKYGEKEQDSQIILFPAITEFMAVKVKGNQIVAVKSLVQADDDKNQDEEDSDDNKKATNKDKSKKSIVKQESSFSKSLIFAIFVYGGIALLILITIKMKANESFAASLIDQCLEATWFKLMNIYFVRKQGYNPPLHLNEDEHIDHGDSVVIGYTENQGRELFWQKNSVEGI